VDFFQYAKLYADPFGAPDVPSPFALRRISAILTWLVAQTPFVYDRAVAFAGSPAERHLLAAAILTNYLCLLGAAVVVSRMVEILRPDTGDLPPLFGGLLCFFAFNTPAHILTGMTDGVSALLAALFLLALIQGRYGLACAWVALSLFQRETLCLMAAAFGGALYLERRDRSWMVAFAALVAAAAYIYIRAAVAVGYPNHTDPQAILDAFTGFRLDREFVFQALLVHNLLFVCIGLRLARRLTGLEPTLFRGLCMSFALIFAAGFAAQLGNGVGRLEGVLVPVEALLIACALSAPPRPRAVADA